MKSEELIQNLYKDLQVVTSDLVLEGYDPIFEEEIQEYFPFDEAVTDWLIKLYASEKYNELGDDELCLYFEKEHPFLFIRDLAHINSWRKGFKDKERQDHISGMMFSMNEVIALEATFCLCLPSQVLLEQGTWFDYKQALTNLEKEIDGGWRVKAWKACSYFYLYFYLTDQEQPIERGELMQVIEPYYSMIEQGAVHGNGFLQKECRMIQSVFGSEQGTTMDFLLGGS